MSKSGFYNIKNEDFSMELENNSKVITQEIMSIPESIMLSWHESEIFDGDWFICPVYLKGVEFGDIMSFIPHITKILKSLNCIKAAISILKPNTIIHPHSDEILNDVLLTHKTYRVQMGISIPNNCNISVLNSSGEFETRKWNEGKTLSFDSSMVHKAQNLSTQNRVVLLADFEKESISEEELNSLISYYLSLYGVL